MKKTDLFHSGNDTVKKIQGGIHESLHKLSGRAPNICEQNPDAGRAVSPSNEELAYYRNLIEAFLDFNLDIASFFKPKIDDVSKILELKSAVQVNLEAYASLLSLQRDNGTAEIVLSSFFKDGEIRDLLKSIQMFVARLDTMQDPAVAGSLGFYNYVFFLRLSVQKMREKYAFLQAEAEPPTEACESDAVNWYIQNECQRVASIRDLPKARAKIRDLTEKTERGEPMAHKDLSALGDVKESLQFLGLCDEDDLVELQQLNQGYADRTKAIKEKVAQAARIRSVIDAILTDEWFDRLDPDIEANRIHEMTIPQIKTLYENATAEIEEMLLSETNL